MCDDDSVEDFPCFFLSLSLFSFDNVRLVKPILLQLRNIESHSGVTPLASLSLSIFRLLEARHFSILGSVKEAEAEEASLLLRYGI